LSFIYILAAFSAYFLRKKDKRPLSSLFSEALGGGSREADSKVADGKVAHSKDIGSGKVSSKKVSGFLADFALFLLLLSTKPYKEHFSIYLLKSY